MIAVEVDSEYARTRNCGLDTGLNIRIRPEYIYLSWRLIEPLITVSTSKFLAPSYYDISYISFMIAMQSEEPNLQKRRLEWDFQMKA
jgi:hypothetical protein